MKKIFCDYCEKEVTKKPYLVQTVYGVNGFDMPDTTLYVCRECVEEKKGERENAE